MKLKQTASRDYRGDGGGGVEDKCETEFQQLSCKKSCNVKERPQAKVQTGLKHAKCGDVSICRVRVVVMFRFHLQGECGDVSICRVWW